ncbi:uncharacterized protein V6R79_022136 [Siganus canaliculatus]
MPAPSAPVALQLNPAVVPVLEVNPAVVPVLEVKLGAVLVLLCVPLLFGLVPLCVVRGAASRCLDSGARRRPLRLAGGFAAGVFLATGLLGLLPDYLQDFQEAVSSAGITLQFPLPEFIVAMGFFLVLILEQFILAFRDQSLVHVEEHRTLLADSGVQVPPHCRRGSEDSDGGGLFQADLGSQSALRTFILVFSLSLHSVFEGLAVGPLQDGKAVLEVCLALVVHKSLVAFSLVLQLWQGRLRRPLVAVCLLLFAAMAPLGIGLGLAQTGSPPRHRLVRCTLEGLGTGTLFYVTFMEVLPQQLGPGRNRIPRVAALLGGFALVTAVRFLKL